MALHVIDFNTTIPGQGVIDLAALERDGIDAVVGKTSEGVGWDEPAQDAMRILKDAWERGMPGMAYHFAWGAALRSRAKAHADAMAATFIRAMGGPDVARNFGLCLDVESYNGQVPPRRQDVLEFFRAMARRLGDVEQFYYGGNWYHNVYIDKPGQEPVLKILARQGIQVHAWSTPDTGYVEGPGSVQQLCSEIPPSEWRDSFGVQTAMIQATAEAQTSELWPIDGNIGRSTIDLKKLGRMFNRP